MSDESSDFPAMFGGDPDDRYISASGYMHRAINYTPWWERQPERIECTRAEFAERMGVWPSPDTIGVCIVSPDGRTVVTEFVFTDEPYPPEKFLTRAALKDIAELERIHKLSQ